MTEKDDYIRLMKYLHPEYTDEILEKKAITACNIFKDIGKESRHARMTESINYKSWKDFDVVAVYAANSPHPLKSVFIGYMYRGDIPCDSKYISQSSVSTDIRIKAEKNGIKLDILSLDDAVNKAKKTDWSKVKIEH